MPDGSGRNEAEAAEPGKEARPPLRGEDLPGWRCAGQFWAAAATRNCVWVVYLCRIGKRGGIKSGIRDVESVWLLKSEAEAEVKRLGEGYDYCGVPMSGTGAKAIQVGIWVSWPADQREVLLDHPAPKAEAGFYLSEFAEAEGG